MNVTEKPRVLVLELSEEEATVICALAGKLDTRFESESEAGLIIFNLFEFLDEKLPNRKTSFIDYFEGWYRSREATK